MNKSLRQLLVASAIGVVSVGASAQTSTSQDTPKTTTSTSQDIPKTADQAYSEYEAAAKACNAKKGLARSDCLRDARDAYDRATVPSTNMGGGHGSPNGSGGTSGTGGPKGSRS
jgi:hypothetical protein